jgi:hypothetical protein
MVAVFLYGRRLTLIAIISSSELVAPRIARAVGNSPNGVVNTKVCDTLIQWQGSKKVAGCFGNATRYPVDQCDLLEFSPCFNRNCSRLIEQNKL